MLSEFKKQEKALQESLESLEKYSDTVYSRLIKQGKWLEDNNYVKPFDNLSDLNIFKFHKLAMELKEIEREINGAKDELLELKHDIFYLESAVLISQYAKAKYHIRLIDNMNKHINEVYCNDYNTYLGNEHMVLVYELVRGKVGVLPYEKIIFVKEEM